MHRRWNSNWLTVAAFTLSFGIVFPDSAALAENIELPVSGQATVSKDGQNQILLKFDGLDALQGKTILHAECVVQLTLDSCGDVIELIAMPITEAWTPSTVAVALADDTAGVETSVTNSTMVGALKYGDGLIDIVVTELVQSWADGKTSNEGLSLTVADSDKKCPIVLQSQDASLKGELGKLVVIFTNR